LFPLADTKSDSVPASAVRSFLQALGIDFISLSEAIDTSTPAGKMTFTVLGAVAELERSLIIECVKAGLRNAQANGKKLGRPKRNLNEQRISALRAQGLGWKAIAADMGVGVGTVLRHSVKGSKTQQKVFGT
jgi:putative DNA-invertase from lambdoid prophage Rac